MAGKPNYRPGVDAGGVSCLQAGRRYPGTTQAGRSATRNMHNYILSFCVIALLFAGCAHQQEQASTLATTGTPFTVAIPIVVSNQLIATFGEHSVGGVWKVLVSRADRSIEVGRVGFGSDRPSDWRAQNGWFVLAENAQRVWAYDGNLDLRLFEWDTRNPTASSSRLSGPGNFDCPVPDAVLTRLSNDARQAIKRND